MNDETSTRALLTDITWEHIKPKLSLQVRNGISELGFTHLTPVQASTIPQFLSYRDVSVDACTGSGKTLAFVVPVLEILQRNTNVLGKYDVGAVIISPTRELAAQILKVFQHFVKYVPQFRVVSMIGGTNQQYEWDTFVEHGGHIVVATPGRLEATLRSVTQFNARTLEVLVLDEADRLLDMGFHTSLTNILGYFPKQRRTGLFSATQTHEVKELAKAGLRNPVRVEVQIQYKQDGQQLSRSTPSTLENYYMIVNGEQKLSQLVHFLHCHKEKKIVVFFLTCACVDYMHKVLTSLPCMSEHQVFAMHGKMVTKKRVRSFDAFVAAQHGVMLSTDVMARGIDIPDVDLILQYDAPQDPSFFVHRIGRTARMGKAGKAYVFLLPQEDTFIEYLRLNQVPITCSEPPNKVEDRLESVKQLALADRDIMEKGQRAYTSYVRAYREHKCNYVFVFSKLPFADVARGFGLLYFPILPDLKHFDIQFENHPRPPSEIKYKDVQREKVRVANLVAKRKKNEVAKKARLELEKAKEKRKKEMLVVAKKRKRKKRTHRDICNEWDELQLETRLMKKVKKGQMTQEEMDEVLFARSAPQVADVVVVDDNDDDDDDDSSVDHRVTPKRRPTPLNAGTKKQKKKKKKNK